MMKRILFQAAVAIALLLHPSASSAALSYSWSPIVKGPMARNVVYCTTFRSFANGSVLMLQVNQQTMRNGKLIVKLMNTDWSITAHTDLPKLTFRAAQGFGLGGVPEAAEHALVIHVPIGSMIEWSESLRGEAFLLMRGSEPLAQFDSAGLAQSIRNVRACGQSI